MLAGCRRLAHRTLILENARHTADGSLKRNLEKGVAQIGEHTNCDRLGSSMCHRDLFDLPVIDRPSFFRLVKL